MKKHHREVIRAAKKQAYKVRVTGDGTSGHLTAYAQDRKGRVVKITFSSSPKDAHVCVKRVIKDINAAFQVKYP